ncbi:MAG: alpha/beta hydrolase [Victivallaceae bacterium]|nr:alpha/beta hydrolase [Victivallaceae bacterium]
MHIDLWPNGEKGIDGFVPYLETSLVPDAGKPLGAVLVCPGGGYYMRADHEGMPVAKAFNQLGFHAFVVHYRVAPNRFPAPLRDALRAIKLVRSRASEFGVDPLRIAICGFSAGGHLAVSTGVMFDRFDVSAGDDADAVSARPDALLPCYSVISVEKDWGNYGSGNNLLGEDFRGDRGDYTLSRLVRSDTPPAVLWHSADDGCVPVRNSLEFAGEMWRNGLTCELHVFPHAPHGVGLALDYPDIRIWPKLDAQFLKGLGFPCAD